MTLSDMRTAESAWYPPLRPFPIVWMSGTTPVHRLSLALRWPALAGSRLTFPLPTVELAASSHATHDLIEHQEDAVFVADSSHGLEVARNRSDVARSSTDDCNVSQLHRWNCVVRRRLTGSPVSTKNAATRFSPTRRISASSSAAHRTAYCASVSPSFWYRYG
jgi:hypothetical protein